MQYLGSYLLRETSGLSVCPNLQSSALVSSYRIPALALCLLPTNSCPVIYLGRLLVLVSSYGPSTPISNRPCPRPPAALVAKHAADYQTVTLPIGYTGSKPLVRSPSRGWPSIKRHSIT